MSWDSYYQRASGTNIDRILGDMSEKRRMREAEERRRAEIEAQRQFEQEQARRDAQARIASAFMQNPSAENYAVAQQMGVDLGGYQESPAQRYNRMAYERAVAAAESDPVFFGMQPGAEYDARYALLTGKNPTGEVSRSGIGLATYGNTNILPAEYVEAQRVSDKIALSAPEREKQRIDDREYETIKLPESKEDIRKTRAEVGRIGAETGETRARTAKLAEETITERELRDPNSPTTRARSSTAGRKTPLQVEMEAVNKRLSSLSEQERSLILKHDAEPTALKKAAVQAQLRRVRQWIKDEMVHRRDVERKMQVSEQRYDANTEAAIANVMTTLGMTREQAIAEARKRGLIR